MMDKSKNTYLLESGHHTLSCGQETVPIPSISESFNTCSCFACDRRSWVSFIEDLRQQIKMRITIVTVVAATATSKINVESPASGASKGLGIAGGD